MATKERRNKIRVDSLNLLEVSVDENEIVVNQGMGRTLNISESGILVETHFPIDVNSTVSLSIAVENDLIDIKGEVMHAKTGETEMFETGIRFLDPDEKVMHVIRKMITLFKEQNDIK